MRTRDKDSLCVFGDRGYKTRAWGPFMLRYTRDDAAQWATCPKYPESINAGTQDHGILNILAPAPSQPRAHRLPGPKNLNSGLHTRFQDFQVPSISPQKKKKKSSQRYNGISLQNLGSQPHPEVSPVSLLSPLKGELPFL